MVKIPVVLYKILVIGVIILFIGIGIQPAISNEVSISNTSDDRDLRNDKEIEEKPSPFPWCIAIVNTMQFNINSLHWQDMGLVPFSIENLDTGKIRRRITNILGYAVFLFLPREQEFLIKIHSFWSSKEYKRTTEEFLNWWEIKL